MFTSMSVTIGTGPEDDLRAGGQVCFRMIIRGRAPFTFEAAEGRGWPGGHEAILTRVVGEYVAIEDVERIEITFIPHPGDGLLLQEDNWWFSRLVVRVVDEGGAGTIDLYRNDAINHYFDEEGTWSSGILPTYSPVGTTIIRVRNASGGPVPDAQVFVNSGYMGATGPDGQLVVATDTLGPNPEIVVRSRVHERHYYRSHHNFESIQDWSFRVYHTNVSIDSTGVARASASRTGSRIDVTVLRANTLIGINMLISAEWALSSMDVLTLSTVFDDASAFLYNATDGQFFVEVAQVHDSRHLWDASDFRVYADWNFGANVPNVLGGFLGWDVMGSAMLMSRRHGGAVYAHEFGHFGLVLDDEYLDSGSAVSCTGAVFSTTSPFRASLGQTSCMMWFQGSAPKICSTHPSNPHVTTTRQGFEACWDTIKRHYNYDRGWRVRSPVDRGGIPSTIRWADGSAVRSRFMLPYFIPHFRPRHARFVGALSLTVSESGGAPAAGVLVRTRSPGGPWMTQGTTGARGMLPLAGTFVGDLIRIERGGFAFESGIPLTPGALTLTIPS